MVVLSALDGDARDVDDGPGDLAVVDRSPPVPLSSMVGLATPGAASTVTGSAAEVPAVSRMKASTLPGS